LEKRSLFGKIFGNKKDTAMRLNRFELLSGNNVNYTPWSGDIFDSDIVRSAIRPKANAVGKLSPKHIRGYGEDMSINPDPRIREILQRPNQYMSMQDFLMKMTFQREIYHNAFAYVKRNPLGQVEEIYPIPYSQVELLECQNEMFAKFRFRAGKTMTVPYEDLIHLRKDFNNNDVFGDSGMNSLNNLMEVINTTDQGIIKAIKNSNVIRWLLKYNQALRPEDIKKNTKDFVDNYLSLESETVGAAATDAKADVIQVEPKDYVPNAVISKEHKERLYSYFGVNENIVQNKYDEDEWIAFYESEVEPILIQLSNAFTKAFFSKREIGYGNRIVFEANNLAYASMKTKLELVQFVDRGIMTPNEVRQILNLGPIVGGDVPVRRLDTAPVEDDGKGVDNNGDGSTGEDGETN
jgi:HK97 family phage portal protein